ncbi:MAG: peptide deformylase [Halobacteriota archaeon]
MAVRKVLMLGNPKLREESSSAEFDSETGEIVQDLKDTLTHLQQLKGIGRALAAPQIGYMKRVVYVQTPSRKFVLVNPHIVWRSEEMVEVWDSCYSFDVAFFVGIERHKSIEVEYQDDYGNFMVERFFDDLSELLQHEIDHLYGVLATDHLKDFKKIISREEWEKRVRT